MLSRPEMFVILVSFRQIKMLLNSWTIFSVSNNITRTASASKRKSATGRYSLSLSLWAMSKRSLRQSSLFYSFIYLFIYLFTYLFILCKRTFYVKWKTPGYVKRPWNVWTKDSLTSRNSYFKTKSINHNINVVSGRNKVSFEARPSGITGTRGKHYRKIGFHSIGYVFCSMLLIPELI